MAVCNRSSLNISQLGEWLYSAIHCGKLCTVMFLVPDVMHPIDLQWTQPRSHGRVWQPKLLQEFLVLDHERNQVNRDHETSPGREGEVVVADLVVGLPRGVVLAANHRVFTYDTEMKPMVLFLHSF